MQRRSPWTLRRVTILALVALTLLALFLRQDLLSGDVFIIGQRYGRGIESDGAQGNLLVDDSFDPKKSSMKTTTNTKTNTKAASPSPPAKPSPSPLRIVSTKGCKIPDSKPDEWFRMDTDGDVKYSLADRWANGFTFTKWEWDPKIPKFCWLSDDYQYLHMNCSTNATYFMSDTNQTEFHPHKNGLSYPGEPVKMTTETAYCWCFYKETIPVNNTWYGAGWQRIHLQRNMRNESVLNRFFARRGVNATYGEKNMNIAIVLVDSLARAHFQRSLPKTMKFLAELNASNSGYRVFDFNRYHVNGWHSDQNTKPLIGGYHYGDFNMMHILNTSTFRNHWRNTTASFKHHLNLTCDMALYGWFEKKGYISMTLDYKCPPKGQDFDAFHTNNFGSPLHYLDTGFPELICKKTVLELMDVLGNRYINCGVNKLGMPWGQRRWVHNNFAYWRTYHKNYQELPKFSIVYINDFHHSLMGQFATKQIDPEFDREWRVTLNEGVLNETLVFFLSDHGLHFGPHLETLEGQIEHKLPFFYVIAPQWWLDQHPSEAANLAKNQDVLLTTFDVHRTIRHLTELPNQASKLPLPSGKFALSLLSEMPLDRNCEDAAVPDAFCICEGQGWLQILPSEAYSDKTVTRIIDVALGYFNNQSIIHHNGTDCSRSVTLREIIDVKRKDFFKGTFIQGRKQKLQFTINPKSHGEEGYNLIEAVIYEKGTGSFEWKAELTGDVEIEYVHRITGATQAEIDKGDRKAEYCIIA